VSIPDGLAGLEDERQAEVGDARRHVRFDEDVLALEVAVSDRGLHLLGGINVMTLVNIFSEKYGEKKWRW
jgi:hypothetical protein